MTNLSTQLYSHEGFPLSSLSCLMESSLRAIISCLKASFYFIFLSLCLLLASCEEHLEFIQSLHGCTIPRVTPTPSIPHPHPVLLGVGVVYWVWVWYTVVWVYPHPVYHTNTQYTTPTPSIPHPGTHRKAILTHCKSHQTGIYLSGTQQLLLEMEELLYPP